MLCDMRSSVVSDLWKPIVCELMNGNVDFFLFIFEFLTNKCKGRGRLSDGLRIFGFTNDEILALAVSGLCSLEAVSQEKLGH